MNSRAAGNEERCKCIKANSSFRVERTPKVTENDSRVEENLECLTDPINFAISEGQQPRDWRGNKITFLGDWIPRIDLDFPDLFTLHPELTEQKIGLREEAFDDFHFHQPDGQSR